MLLKPCFAFRIYGLEKETPCRPFLQRLAFSSTDL